MFNQIRVFPDTNPLAGNESILDETLNINLLADSEPILDETLNANVSENNPFHEIKQKLKGFIVEHINITTLPKYIDQLRMYLIHQPFHVLSINETRLNENISDDSVKICGYEIFRKDRNREGGGVALYIKTALNANVRLDLVPDGLEAVCVEIQRLKSKPLLIGTWYRPPNSAIEMMDKFELFVRSLEGKSWRC